MGLRGECAHRALFSEHEPVLREDAVDEYSVWWCGALTYLRTRDIFSQNEDYIAADFRKIKEVGAPTAREA